MKPWRRFFFLGFGVVMLALGGGFFYAVLAGVDRELVSWFTGFGMIFSAIGLMISVRCLNAVRSEELAVLDDVTATAHFTMPRFDRYSVVVALVLITVGFSLWAIDGFILLFQILGGLVAIMSACGLIATLRMQRTPTLRLSPEGLECSGLGCGIIDWRDIRNAEASNGRVPMVVLELWDAQKYLSRRPKRWWGFAGFMVTSPILGLSPDRIAKAIDIRRAAFGKAGQQVAR